MKLQSQFRNFSVAIAMCIGLSACSSHSTTTREEHYTSPKVEVDSQKINLEEVQKAFWDSKGKDLPTWMGEFEKKVNEIYDGNEVVAIDATRKDQKLVVTGFIDKDNKEGFQPGDEKVFSIEQTGEAANNEMPYRVSGYNDRPYYEGHHSFLGNGFLTGMLVSHAMNSWGGGYNTRASQVVILRDHRDSYRQTPQYSQTKASNEGFFSRFKKKDAGSGFQSNKKFGDSGFSASSGSDTTKKRSFWGSSSSSSSSSTSSGWGGKRSSSSGFGSSLRRGWGGRRR